MRQFTFTLIIVVALLLAACGRAQQSPSSSLQFFQFATATRGRLLIKFRESVGEGERNSMVRQMGARPLKIIDSINVHLVTFENDSAARRALQSLDNQALVIEYAEEDLSLPASEFVPNDPSYPGQWHLPTIAAPAGWGLNTGAQGVTIAILDTGVNPHPDFAEKMVAGTNVHDGSTDTSDVYGHGTKVAGVAAAIGNNALNVAGVAWGCRIMPVRVAGVDGYASYSTLAAGLIWSADNGARVANISYDASLSLAVADAARYFQERGGVVAIAAGNVHQARTVPGNEYFLTVSATNVDGSIASFSNTGTNIDIAAPGVGILTTGVWGGESQPSGTSFSAPIVAGVAGLLLSVNPALSGRDARLILKQTSADAGAPGWDEMYGAGLVNVLAALQPLGAALDYPPTAAITSHVNGQQVRNTEAIKISYTDDHAVIKSELYVQGLLVSSSTTAPFTTYWNVKPISSGSYPVQVVVYDALHNAGLSSTLNLMKR